MTNGLGPLARELSLPYYEDALPGHDRFHADRVQNLALQLADESDRTVDRGVVAAAAYFHDIGRPRERTGDIEDHGEWGAEEAAALLEPEGVATERIKAIQHCLRTHSIRENSPEPATSEAEFLFDADKLEATGAVGLVRLACIVGERSGRTGGAYAVLDDPTARDLTSPDRPDVTLLRKWARERLDALYTEPGRQIGESRWQFMQNFFDQFEREIRYSPHKNS